MESNTNLEKVHSAYLAEVDAAAKRAHKVGNTAVSKLPGSKIIALDMELTHEDPLDAPADDESVTASQFAIT